MDILSEILHIQKSFQIKNSYKPYIHDLASAIMAEGGELWAIAGGKWWKEYLKYRDTWGHLSPIYLHKYIKDTEHENRAKIIEESIDVLHFLLAVWVELGLTSEDVFLEYKRKMGINQERQDTNY